jgi:hypothetical protein
MDRQQQPPQQPGQPRDPFADNPLFQAAFGHAQKAALDATMQGQDPYRAALQAAQAGVRQAAQPDPSQPGGGNLQKVQQHLMQLHPEMSPDQALAIAHQALPRLVAGGGGQGVT